eukprot:CAMPEP_0201569710 /NCGR_PEP_ID=MMETSP0190_2-20130828/11545_1 /ASSEMBLY_ACC=CAM_ASM_000263 /TAXON_ID=37353 /ORGANISM="Rosalina sp." /LENGTH=182 /DNA_ID=CAMNT_0047992357 /DNA_START=531 /DNA_END=1079 /DNA_ORIENTATION=+
MFKAYKSFGSMIGAWSVLSLFITASFALSVGGFFFFHVHLLRENKTTLENMKYRGQNTPYQRAKAGKENFNDVFGDVWYLWFVPTVTLKETGYEMYNDGVSASLIKNDYNNYDEEDDNETGNGKKITTVPHRAPPIPTQNGNGTIVSNRNGRNGSTQIQEEEDPKIINQKPIDIGPGPISNV